MTRIVRATALTKLGQRDEDHEDSRPLDFRLIARLMGFMRPYARQRNWLLVSVVLRAIQLPALTGVLAAVINGPIQQGDTWGVVVGAVVFAGLALFTQITMHFRQRYALEMGEAIVF
ncbi:MAG: ABC transporter ATP-binding protein, partial [Candidatus Saccharimonas sp.]|nr:ABC transporter ATP-binding protein [Planctomycetaceae bacterium]